MLKKQADIGMSCRRLIAICGLAAILPACFSAIAESATIPVAEDSTNMMASALDSLPSNTNIPGPFEIRLGEAVIMALTNNRALSVERLTPAVRRTFEENERAVFDPILSAEILAGQTRSDWNAASNSLAGDVTTKSVGGAVGVSELLPTGSRIDITANAKQDTADGFDSEFATRAEISVTQALLQGRPVAVNLASLRQARLDTEISEYALRDFAETLVATVEGAYWECALARRRVEIFEKSLGLASQQLNEIEHRIRVGDLSETELSAAQAESALREEALINAKSEYALISIRLLRLINPDALARPRQELVLTTAPAVPVIKPDTLESHVALALRMRPDMNEARLKLRKNELELVKTKNGLLPKLDFFILLGQTGYAESFGSSVRGEDGRKTDLSAGLRLEYPVPNRAERFRHQRARFTQEQTTEALKNLEDLVRVDIEGALIEIERTRKQVTATATTRKFQEEKVRAETAKFNVGRSTALLVAQAQRDLVDSQVSEVVAVVRHLDAWIVIFRQEGSLLERRGLSAPGRQPAQSEEHPVPDER